MRTPTVATLGLLTVAATTTSCSLFSSPTGAELSQRVQADASALRTEATDLESELVELIAAIDSIQDSKELLEPKFERLTKSIDKVRDVVDDVTEAHEDTREHQVRYEKVWAETLDGYKDASLRGKSQGRLQTVSASFQEQAEDAQQVEKIAGPMLDELADIEKYLRSDLSKAGVDSISNNLSAARSKAAELRRVAGRLQTSAKKSADVLDSEGVVRG